MFFLRHPFLVFFLFSLSEAVLLAKVGSQIGWGWTILAIVATAMVGSAMWRQQGLETWQRVNQRMAQGELPGSELIEGVLLIVGGALLITPGFITDTVGFLFLFPLSRKTFARWLFDKGLVQGWSQQGGFQRPFGAGGYREGGFSGAYRTGPNSKVWVYQKQWGYGDSGQQDSANSSQNRVEGQSGDSANSDTIEGEYISKDDR
ncbi:MAG: FxsA family protein [Pseudomonadales bacterium]|nr:FxsA family protein [Pseudomonadales bacterium]